MGGKADPTDLGVVGIIMMTSSEVGVCSGSLIAPNLVLTAHHCVAPIENGSMGVDCGATGFGAPYSPGSFFVTTKELMSQNPSDYHTVREVAVTPGSGLCGVDEALLILSDNLAPSEATPLVPRIDTPLVADEGYSAIGYGGTQDDGSGSGTRRRLDGLKVDCVGERCAQLYGPQINAQHEWGGDHGICEGDSGGPAMDLQGRVVGVTSRGGSGCTAPIYGDVHAWADWMKTNAQHAAQVGGYDAAPWVTGFSTDPVYAFPIGDTCTDNNGCGSSICLSNAAHSYCSRQCADDAAPCPGNFECIDNGGGVKVCSEKLVTVPLATGDEGPPVAGCSQSAGLSVLAATLLLPALRRRRRTP
jgi:hypothetical protein